MKLYHKASLLKKGQNRLRLKRQELTKRKEINPLR